MKLLEKAIKIAIFLTLIYVFWMILKFDLIEKNTLSIILGVLILIGLGDIVDTIIKTYKLIVYLINKKQK